MSTVEKAVAAIDPDEVVALTTALCSIPSQAADELEVAMVIAEALDVPGVDVHVEEVVVGRANVIATVEGTGERPPLVLNGHMDASIPEEGWSHDPYDPWVESGRLYGAGVSDMKGAVAAMAAAVRTAASMGPPPGDLILQSVMHHDTIGLGTKFVLASEGPTEGYAICGEPSNLAIHTANGGALKFEIRFTGETGHISRMEGSRDALEGAVAAYSALRELRIPFEPCEQLPDLPRMLLGELHAGTSPAAVADDVVIRGDLRIVPGMRRAAVRSVLDETARAAVNDEIGVTTRIIAAQKPFIGPTSGRLVDAVSTAHAGVLGAAPRITNELPGQAFVTDAADLAHFGLETIVYGAGEWHFAPDESVPIADLVGSAAVYLAVAYDL